MHLPLYLADCITQKKKGGIWWFSGEGRQGTRNTWVCPFPMTRQRRTSGSRLLIQGGHSQSPQFGSVLLLSRLCFQSFTELFCLLNFWTLNLLHSFLLWPSRPSSLPSLRSVPSVVAGPRAVFRRSQHVAGLSALATWARACHLQKQSAEYLTACFCHLSLSRGRSSPRSWSQLQRQRQPRGGFFWPDEWSTSWGAACSCPPAVPTRRTHFSAAGERVPGHCGGCWGFLADYAGGGLDFIGPSRHFVERDPTFCPHIHSSCQFSALWSTWRKRSKA